MSRNSSTKLSAQDRLALARRIKELRLQRGIRQDQLAEWASVSRQTLSDIENGNVAAPQMKTLVRIYDALGVDIQPPEFEEQTQLWLAMLGTLIEAVPEERRSNAVDKAVVAISGEITGRGSVTPLRPRDVRPSTHTDLETVELDSTKIAASTDDTPVDPSRGEA